MFSTIFTDGRRCTIVGSGDPNAISATLATGCTEGVYFNSNYNNRNPIAVTWVWNGSSWIAR